MKYCPVCKRRFDEAWLSFCSDDGTPLIQELTPPADPNWNPALPRPKVKKREQRETEGPPPRPAPSRWLDRARRATADATGSVDAAPASSADDAVPSKQDTAKPGIGAGVYDYGHPRVLYVRMFRSASGHGGACVGSGCALANQEVARKVRRKTVRHRRRGYRRDQRLFFPHFPPLDNSQHLPSLIRQRWFRIHCD